MHLEINGTALLDDAYMWLELAAIFFAGVSGALAAVRKNFDIFSVLLLAWVTGLGGGLMRDVLIGAVPPVGITQWRYVAAALLAGALVHLFHVRLDRLRRAIIVFDAGALAMFVVIGTHKGLEYGVGPLAAAFVGVFTGIGGGLVRDLLVDEAPIVLRDRELYAIPATGGAILAAWVGVTGHLNYVTGGLICLVIFAVRLVSLRLRWRAPGPWQGFGVPRRTPRRLRRHFTAGRAGRTVPGTAVPPGAAVPPGLPTEPGASAHPDAPDSSAAPGSGPTTSPPTLPGAMEMGPPL